MFHSFQDKCGNQDKYRDDVSRLKGDGMHRAAAPVWSIASCWALARRPTPHFVTVLHLLTAVEVAAKRC